MGDFNIDSNGKVIPLDKYQVRFPKAFNQFDKKKLLFHPDDKKNSEVEITEYDALLHILSNGGQDYLKDWFRFEHVSSVKPEDQDRQATYADWIYDESGKKVPVDKSFTWKCDGGHNLSIDYIFEYVPNGSAKQGNGIRSLNPHNEIGFIKGTCQANPMKVENKVFSHMSDHYAVEAIIGSTEHQ